MRPKEEIDPKIQTGTFILSEKIDDTKLKKSEKEMKKEMKRLEKEKQEREKREKKAREKEKEREKQTKKGKVVCGACGGKCSGEVLRVTDKYFHTACFTCRTCTASLAKGGFFCKDGYYYCPQDYQRAFGTRCAACGQYVEGEVVAALGNTYHQKCFTCARCKRAFPSGEKVTYTGAEVVCSGCVAPQRHTARATPAPAPASASAPASAPSPAPAPSLDRTDHSVRDNGHHDQNGNTTAPASPLPNSNECAGCGQELSEGQALVALDRQWHTWCFACGECGAVLAGEYMGRGGLPYCERDYQRLYGVRCAYCSRYISGKVLQAGENHHFHPTCARCTKCGDPFGDGEEMFLQGAAIWHPRCGPAPDDGRASAELQFSLRSRTPSVNGSYCSPYSSLSRKYGYGYLAPGARGSAGSGSWAAPHRITTYSYLAASPAPGLRRPLAPADRPPTSPHYHRPASASSLGGGRWSRAGPPASRPATGMRALVDAISADLPRPKSPRMNNEEPIELSHYPSAFKPAPGTQPKIERDDFPAPPYPYTDPERRRRWSDTYKGVDSDSEENGERALNGDGHKLKREEQELAKIDTGIAQVFLKEVKEREKLQQWKKQNLDPRNASRTPSAAREAGARLRYSSPVGASPSRSLDHARTPPPTAHTPSLTALPSYNVVSSLRAAPRPGYGLANRSHTFSSSTAGDFTFSGMGDKTHSTDFSSGKSDISAGSITDVDRSALTTTDGGVVVRGCSTLAAASGLVRGVGMGGSGGGGGGGGGGVRRSLPNMATSRLLHEPAKLYPYHLLLITNYRLPPDVDRLNLERHLSDAEFEAILQIGRPDFYRLPQWRRNELKRRARLF